MIILASSETAFLTWRWCEGSVLFLQRILHIVCFALSFLRIYYTCST